MNKIYFITGNEKKLLEARRIVPNLEMLDIDLPEIQETDSKMIIETKLKSAFEHRDGEFIVEDTGLYMDCLGGLPGPLIKWFMKPLGLNGLYDLARQSGKYGIYAKTTIGYARSRTDFHFFEGIVKGTIVNPIAPAKFGWDPLFKPDGFEKTYAEMLPEEKNSVSQRGVAFRKLKEFLDSKTG